MTGPDRRNCPALIRRSFPDRGLTATIGKSMLDEGYIACANIIPEVVSLFVWNGERDERMEAATLTQSNSVLQDDACACRGRLGQ